MEKKSEADWAYQIIEEKEGPVFYQELIQEIMRRMNKTTDDAKTMASIYTRINIDNRLVHIGEGYWILRSR
ncbi:MAG: DNA-directed RNA polymerase subunit delta [Candidatus Saccharibacteria bacterium]